MKRGKSNEKRALDEPASLFRKLFPGISFPNSVGAPQLVTWQYADERVGMCFKAVDRVDEETSTPKADFEDAVHALYYFYLGFGYSSDLLKDSQGYCQ